MRTEASRSKAQSGRTPTACTRARSTRRHGDSIGARPSQPSPLPGGPTISSGSTTGIRTPCCRSATAFDHWSHAMAEPVVLDARNPGPLTGSGNNTYLLASNGVATLVDAGVGHPDHLAAL